MTDRPRFSLHLGVLLAALGVWTWKLLEPHPVPASVRDELSAGAFAVLAKSAHAGAYAFLAMLAWTLPVSRRWRLALVAFLVLHGVGTEIGQTFVPNRTGRATDVLIDWCGVIAGLAVLRLWKRRPA